MLGNLEQLLADILRVYLPSGETEPGLEGAEGIPFPGPVDPPPVTADDEETIAAVMLLLRRIAAAAEGTSTLRPPPPNPVYGVFSGSELIMRWECLDGRGESIPGLLHGFAYLVTVFFLSRDLALRRSNEVRALVEAAGYETR